MSGLRPVVEQHLPEGDLHGGEEPFILGDIVEAKDSSICIALVVGFDDDGDIRLQYLRAGHGPCPLETTCSAYDSDLFTRRSTDPKARTPLTHAEIASIEAWFG